MEHHGDGRNLKNSLAVVKFVPLSQDHCQKTIFHARMTKHATATQQEHALQMLLEIWLFVDHLHDNVVL